MSKYPGITTKVMKDGSKNIMVRFKHLGKTYPIKNFTKLYGSSTQLQAFNKLHEVKLEISKGRDPFISTIRNLNFIFDDRVETKIRNGEWKESTPKNYLYFYNRYIRNTIGHKKLEKIKYEDLLGIYKNELAHVANSTKNTFKLILRPIFVEEMKKGNIHRNVIDDLETYNIPVREKLELRVDDNNINIVRKLYAAIPLYKTKSEKQQKEVTVFLYLALLTAHRFGELMKLTREDCYVEKKMIIAPKGITKTKEDYKYPIPDECIDYIDSIKSGLIFPSIKRGSVYQIFQRVVTLSRISVYNNKKISLHDTRRLMLSIMIKELRIDSTLADTCLNHKQRGVINHYLSYEYADIEESYKLYWEFI